MTEPALVSALADVAQEYARRAIEPAVSLSARFSVLDWAGAAIGGSEHPTMVHLREAYGSAAGASRVMGPDAQTSTAETAAFLNGTAAHALEVDDIYAPGTYHPGAPTIAAALAVADEVDASGAELLGAVVAGTEVGCRIAEDLGPAHYKYWHTTGTAGAVGAAVAASIAWSLSPEKMAHAIAIAGTMASGVQQTFRTGGMAKPIHAGHAAQSGVTAARAARAGVTGALDVLDGPVGLAAATRTATEWGASKSGVQGTPLICSLTVKPYPCCGHTFAPIGAAIDLRREGIALSEIEDVCVETYTAGIDTAGIRNPETSTEARFSIPFTVATALARGRVDVGSFDHGSLTDSGILSVMRKVRLVAHERFDSGFPARRGAAVSLRLRGGVMRRAEVSDRYGSPENPLGREALADKFSGLVDGVFGAETAVRIAQSIDGLETLSSVADIPFHS